MALASRGVALVAAVVLMLVAAPVAHGESLCGTVQSWPVLAPLLQQSMQSCPKTCQALNTAHFHHQVTLQFETSAPSPLPHSGATKTTPPRMLHCTSAGEQRLCQELKVL